MMFLTNFSHYALLAIGLGFVVFFHELGHFLAAKYSDVFVEQFALGFGPAIVAWRKGIGLRRGTTTPEMNQRLQAYWTADRPSADQITSELTPQQSKQAMDALNLGETEYRLNWIPLGGYVKMLGQDDMDPSSLSNDPRSFNKKPIRQRMLIISAGVLMNVLLAAIVFMGVFLIGLKAPPAEVGGVLNNSPASFATRDDGSRQALQVGDRILFFNGHYQHGFGSVALTVALAREGESLPMLVRHTDGTEETLHVTPARTDPAAYMLNIGIIPPTELLGPDKSEDIAPEFSDPNLYGDDVRAIQRGDTITAINGQAVPAESAELAGNPTPGQYWRLQNALSNQDLSPVTLTLGGDNGSTRQVAIHRHFQTTFGRAELTVAGMTPRVRVDSLADKKAPAYGIVRPGDVIESIASADGAAQVDSPNPDKLRDLLNAAGQDNKKIILTLLSPDGSTRKTDAIVPTYALDDDKRGLGIGLAYDEDHAVISDVAPDSAAAKAGIKPGWTITKFAGEIAENWFHIRRLIAAAQPGTPIAVEAQTPAGPVTVQLTLTPSDIESARFLTITTDAAIMLHQRVEIRKTDNPLTAAAWGVTETRDFILQFYLSLRRIFAGSVSYKMAMGPVGIVKVGAASAAQGIDELLWFLAMISANLAVVNFLPVPVMDGGLFVLLILESIQGKPLSVKTQQVIQMVGLAMILTLFILITYQDITRQMGHG